MLPWKRFVVVGDSVAAGDRIHADARGHAIAAEAVMHALSTHRSLGEDPPIHGPYWPRPAAH